MRCVLSHVLSCMLALMVIQSQHLAKNELTVTSVIMNDETEIAVVQSAGVDVPTVDDVFGLISIYPRPLFVAHDYLAGNHIMNMMNGGRVILRFSDGSQRIFRITGYLNLGFDSQAEYQYVDNDCVYFQTCNGEGIRTVIACDV